MLNFSAFRTWWNGVKPAGPAAATSAPADPPPPGPTPAMARRVALWFSQESTEEVTLALETLQALAQASPRVLDRTLPNQTPMAWLLAALDALEAIPEPLPLPAHLPVLPWRYLVYTRLACDTLEGAYGHLGRLGVATQCPLTALPDPCPAPRRLGSRREHRGIAYDGLGALLVGRCFSEAGQRRIYAAHTAGVNWSDSTAFWALLEGESPAGAETASTKPPPPPPPPPPHATRATTAPGAAKSERPPSAVTPRQNPSATAKPQHTPSATVEPQRPIQTLRSQAPSATVKSQQPPPPRAGSPPGPPTTTLTPPPATDPLAAITRAALAALVATSRFNQQSGDAWFCQGEFYVAAKAFAERLQAHPWVEAQPVLHDRKALYRELVVRCLIVPYGGQKVWPLFVTEPGQTEARFVSALKLSPPLYEGIEPRLPFQGTLRPATARERRR